MSRYSLYHRFEVDELADLSNLEVGLHQVGYIARVGVAAPYEWFILADHVSKTWARISDTPSTIQYIYLDGTSGSDTAAGGASTPVATLAEALRRVGTAGGVIHVLTAGTYTHPAIGSAELPFGRLTGPLAIYADPSTFTVLDSGAVVDAPSDFAVEVDTDPTGFRHKILRITSGDLEGWEQGIHTVADPDITLNVLWGQAGVRPDAGDTYEIVEPGVILTGPDRAPWATGLGTGAEHTVFNLLAPRKFSRLLYYGCTFDASNYIGLTHGSPWQESDVEFISCESTEINLRGGRSTFFSGFDSYDPDTFADFAELMAELGLADDPTQYAGAGLAVPDEDGFVQVAGSACFNGVLNMEGTLVLGDYEPGSGVDASRGYCYIRSGVFGQKATGSVPGILLRAETILYARTFGVGPDIAISSRNASNIATASNSDTPTFNYGTAYAAFYDCAFESRGTSGSVMKLRKCDFFIDSSCSGAAGGTDTGIVFMYDARVQCLGALGITSATPGDDFSLDNDATTLAVAALTEDATISDAVIGGADDPPTRAQMVAALAGRLNNTIRRRL